MKIVDMHCDTISVIQAQKRAGYECRLLKNSLMIDLNRLQESHYLLQNFAMFVDVQKEKHKFQAVLDLISLFLQEMKDNADVIRMVRNVEEILENDKMGKLSALLTVEEGGVCEGSLENLYSLYDRGVRMMTLTWNYPNDLGYPNYNERGEWNVPDTEHGLTKLGVSFVEEMERLGMIIDVSHLSDAGFYDVFHNSKKPFVASHSNARGLCAAARNLSDDMIRKIGERGGVIGLNFSVDFLRNPTGENRVDARNPKNWGKGYASLMDIVRHAEYISNIGGMECVGIGSDFDGIVAHPQLQGAGQMDRLVEAWKQAGFCESAIDKICYQNVLRVYKEVLK